MSHPRSKMHFDFSEEFLERFHTGRLNAHVRQRQRQRQINALSRAPTRKQTIKVNHFLLTPKLKPSVPQRIILSEWRVLVTASSQEYEMQTRPEGHYCTPSAPPPQTITNHSLL